MTTAIAVASPVLAQESGSSIFGLLVPLVLIFGVMYFLLIRPQQRRSQAQQRLMAELEPGDEVVTIGGLFGDVVEVSDDRVLVEAYDGTQMEFLRSAIARRIVPEDAVEDDAVEDEPPAETKALDAKDATKDPTKDTGATKPPPSPKSGTKPEGESKDTK